MTAMLTQDMRMIAISTPLGKDYFLLRGFTGEEGISRLFTFGLDLLSQNPSVEFKDIIGKRVTIQVNFANDKVRYFNGFINRFEQIGCDTGLTTYRATMVPWLWFLTQTTDCRIFQNKRVPDIIQQIFKEYGFTDFRVKLETKPEAREYCVQYRETDFNFVTRLMEQYGMFYFFEHEKEKHTLVVADAPSIHQPCPEKEVAHWQPFSVGMAREQDVITSLRMEQHFRPGKYALSDYSFEAPRTSLLSEVATTIKVGGNGAYEIYDFPGKYEKKKDGETLATLRMQQEEAQHLLIRGTSTCRAFTSGYRFSLKQYGRTDMNKDYVLTNLTHIASVGESYTTGTGTASEGYENQFMCIPLEVPYRPPLVTRKPFVQGVQTAVVVGKAGEEIWTDNYGRVKVHFFWDREVMHNEDSSCWVRVSQSWAGKQWGAMFLPRINQEVIVEFLEGDPDRPIITGRVYNAEQMPPYELPAHQTKSGIKSRSSKGATPENFNEIRFEDKKGEEELYIHAEKNEKIVVKHNKSESVGGNESISIGHDRKEEVGHDETITVKNDHTETIGGNMSLTVSGFQMETIHLASTENVGLGKELGIGLGYQVGVGGAMNETIGAAHVSEVGAYRFEKVVGYKTTDVKETITMKSDKEIVLETGSSKLSMNKDGKIELSGTDVTIKTAAGTIQIDAGGIITIKGSMVKINT